MENEENRGRINKKASEDHFVTFCQCYILLVHIWSSLSTLPLSHSWTLRVFLEHFGIGSRKAKKASGSKDQASKSKIKQLQQYSLQVSIYICIFLTRFGMPGIACGSFAVMAWVFQGVTMFLTQPYHFLISMV